MRKVPSEYSNNDRTLVVTKSSLKAGRDSQATIKKAEVAVNLEIDQSVKRPNDEGMDKEDIEYSILKKRIRVIMDAKNKAEKAQQDEGVFAAIGPISKGGAPNMRLRNVNEADFFQKNNSVEKGWTFNNDGSLVEFRKPKLTKELDEKVSYEVANEAYVNAAFYGR